MCMNTYVYLCACTFFYMWVCIWKPKYHWKRERLKVGSLVYLGAEVIEDEQRRGCGGMNGWEKSLRKRIWTCFSLIVGISTYIPSIQGTSLNWLSACKLPKERIWPVCLRLGIHPLVQAIMAEASVTEHRSGAGAHLFVGSFDCCLSPILDSMFLCSVAQHCLQHLVRYLGQGGHSKGIYQKGACTRDLTNEGNGTGERHEWVIRSSPPSIHCSWLSFITRAPTSAELGQLLQHAHELLWSSLSTTPHLREWCKLEIMLLILNNWHKTNSENWIHLEPEKYLQTRQSMGRTRPESKGICQKKLGGHVLLFPSDYLNIFPVKSNFLKWPLFIGNYLVSLVEAMAYF